MVALRKNGLASDPPWPLFTPVNDENTLTWGHNTTPLILTHDVDTRFGFENIMAVVDVERRLGFKSCWFIVPCLYEVDVEVLELLRKMGFEVGVHDWNHDGKLFSSRRVFDERIVKINSVISSWEARGFRAGMVYHNDEWMGELESKYDASYYDSDPFQPMGGGSARIRPFLLNHVVELPYTMAQDHVLFVVQIKIPVPPVSTEKAMEEVCAVIRDYSKNYQVTTLRGVHLWKLKATWLREKKGMVLMCTHSDYLCDPRLKISKRRLADTKFGYFTAESPEILKLRSEGIISKKWQRSLLEQYAAFLLWYRESGKNKLWNPLPREFVDLLAKENAE